MTKKKAQVGYSGAPLAKKLGIKPGAEILVVNGPKGYRKLLEPLPEGVRFVTSLSTSTGFVQIFVTSRAELAKALEEYRTCLKADAVVWVSWPKKAAKVQTDVTDHTVREVALPLGFVDIKVCAIDDTWSGLKIVVRKELRCA